ncbi:TolC family protein [Haloferula sp. A504]|uniref:TolC family protein n=1 Tax=Haloferula sp. A504 TaxID=3373601 RepID=UPI0031C80A5B|nr:TolC family protein [Verrucomicrobiaceae bacterium E54]
MNTSTWLLALLLPACQGPDSPSAAGSDPSPSIQAASGPKTPAQVPAEVSLEDVCSLALKHHPDLRRFPYDDRAADARRLIAGRPPNPSVSLELEDFAGNGVYSGTRSAIYTATLVQLLETGGKRGARAAEAGAAQARLRADYETRRREVLEQASQDFVEALAEKESLALAERELELAESGLQSVGSQVEAGRATESQRKLAAMAVTQAKLEVRSSRRGFERSLARLAALWGGGSKPSRVRGLLTPPPKGLPSRAQLAGALESHPEVAAARRREDEAQARVKLARAGRYPDVEVGLGARHDRASGDDALVLGASVPLPLIETGRDGVKAAEAEAASAALAIESARLDLQRRFESAWAAFADGHDAAVTAENELLPGAREVFSSIDESYRLGRTGFLEWLEAGRQLAAANRRWLEARRDYQQAAATLQALTGQSL